MTKLNVRLLLLLTALSFSTPAIAQLRVTQKAPQKGPQKVKLVAQNTIVPASSSTMSVTVPKPAQDTKSWGLDLGLDYSSNLYKENSEAKESGLDWTFAPSYRFTKNLSLSAKTVITQQQSGPKDTVVSNSLITLGLKGYAWSNETFLKHSLTAIVPTNKDSQEIDRLQGGVRLTNGISSTLDIVTVSYALGLQRNFHEFTVNADGSPNIQWSLRHILELKLALTDRWSLNYAGLYSQGRTYNSYERSSFTSDLYTEVAMNDQFSASAGVSNEGSALRSNGRDSNIQVFDDKSSSVHVGVAYAF